jgi:glycosyltransferase involved in cell wall biosynthesis
LFSLLVCSVERDDHIDRLFRSLAVQTYKAFEVVLVDQNVDDRLGVYVDRYSAQFPLRRIRSPRGLSLARNRGIVAARGEFLAFPDDDCWYRRDTLEQVVRKFATDPALSAVTGRTLDADDQPSLSPSADEELAIDRSNFLVCGNSNSIFVRRELIDDIGGFDERLGVGAQTPFQSGEEADLLLRSVAAGKRLRYFPDVIVHHDQVDRDLTMAHAERGGRYGRGFGALLRKHGYGKGYLAYRLFRPFASACLAALRLDRPTFAYKWAWMTGIASGYRTWDSVSSDLPFSTAAELEEIATPGRVAAISA